MKQRFVAGLLIFSICALIRIALLDRQGLGTDEFFSLAIATGHSLEQPANLSDPDLGDYVEATRALPPEMYNRYLEHEMPPSGLGRVVRAVFLSDTSPPLYYILLYGWTSSFGTGDISLRLFSVLCLLAGFPLIWSLAKKIGGAGAAIPSCIIFTFSPYCIFYSTEGRMYSLLLLCSLCLMWLTLRLWDKGPSLMMLILWVGSGVAGLLTHYFFFFIWIAALFWLQLHAGRFSRKLSLACALLTILLVLPWYFYLPESFSNWRVTSGWLKIRPDYYKHIRTPLLLPWNFLTIKGTWGGRQLLDWINAGVFILLFLATFRKLSWSLFSKPLNLIWFWLLSPCVGVVVFDLIFGTYVSAVPRYALAGMPAAFLLVGLGIGNLGYRRRFVFIALIVILCLTGVRIIYLAESRRGQPYREVAKLLTSEIDEFDLILVNSIPSGVIGVAHYLERYRASETGVGFASWVGQLGRRRVPEDLLALAAGRKRVILIIIHEIYAPAHLETWLNQNGTLDKTNRFHPATVHYFSSRDSAGFFSPPLKTD